jgi:hypothetical protein
MGSNNVNPARIPRTIRTVVPYSYYLNINTTSSGTVLYKNFTSPDPEISRINTFIQSQENTTFNGTYMLAAEWNRLPVPRFGGAALISSHVKMVIVYPNESDVMEPSNVTMGVMRKIAAAALCVKMESVWGCSWFAMVTMTAVIIVTK